MEFNWLLVLAVVWFLMNLISNARRKPQAPPRPLPRQGLPPRPLPSAPDATQREGSRLEQMLRQLERSLEDVAQPDHPMRIPLPPAEEVEDRESLEVEPEIRSLEGEVRREVRRRVDQDDEAEGIEVRRIQAAAARDSARTKVDHIAFDQRIRQEVADHTDTPRYTARQLRDAMVWREILGPPVALREDGG
jgi:hypothetical protein